MAVNRRPRNIPESPEVTSNFVHVWTGLEATPNPENQDRKAVNNHGAQSLPRAPRQVLEPGANGLLVDGGAP